MKLTHFRIRNFRSINDSGEVEIDKLTALVGRNESGKSNLLLALATLNPPGGRQPLSKIKDFPRARRLEECTDDTPVVDTSWELTKDEIAELDKILNQTAPVTTVSIGRRYSAKPCFVGIDGLEYPVLDAKVVGASIRRLAPILAATINKIDEPLKAKCLGAWTRIESSVGLTADKDKWSAEIKPAVEAIRTSLGEASSC